MLDLAMYGTESNMEDVVLKVLELNAPDVSREEEGGENGKDSREEEEGEENSNASPSPTLVVGEDVVMRVVKLNMSGVSIDDKGGKDREVVDANPTSLDPNFTEQPAVTPTSFQPCQSSSQPNPKELSSPNGGGDDDSSEDIEVPPAMVVMLDFSEQLAAKLGISFEPCGSSRNTPNGGGDNKAIEATDDVPNHESSDAVLAVQLTASLEPRRSHRSTASKTASTPMLVTPQKIFNAKRKLVLKKAAIALQVIS